MVHKALAVRGSATVAVIAADLEISTATARRHLETLVEQGRVTRQKYLARNPWGRYTPRVTYTVAKEC